MTSAVTRTLVARLTMSDLEGDERVALAVRLGDRCRGGGRDLEATAREERAQVSLCFIDGHGAREALGRGQVPERDVVVGGTTRGVLASCSALSQPSETQSSAALGRAGTSHITFEAPPT